MVIHEHTTEETWKAVPKFEGYYEVSDHGRVRRILSRHGTAIQRMLKPHCDKYGYPYVILMKGDGYRHTCKIHRMVCEAFNGPQPDTIHTLVRHVNDIKTDNRPENVVWGTHLENVADAAGYGAYPKGEHHVLAVFTQVQVDEVRARHAHLLNLRRAQGFRGVPLGTLPLWAKEYGVKVDVLRHVLYGYGYGFPQKKVKHANQ